MKKHLFYFLAFLPWLGFGQVYYWEQLGTTVNGTGTFGAAVSVSADGLTMASGAQDYSGSQGLVQVFHYDGSGWVQKGQDLLGETVGDKFGNSVSLSADGNTLAVGAPYNDGGGINIGSVRIFHYDGTTWEQIGQDIDGTTGMRSGLSIALNADGNRLAVVTVYNNLDDNPNSGFVKIYDYDGAAWNQSGQTIYGEAAADNSGWSISFNSEGNIIAIGAFGNDPNGLNFAGHTRVFQYDGTAWVQIGQDIDGIVAGEQSGWSVDLNGDGTTVVVGAYLNGTNGANSGQARVYHYNGASWEQLGQSLNGEAAQNKFGHSVSINSAGDIIAVCAPQNGTSPGTSQREGATYLYRYNGDAWELIGEKIAGASLSDADGSSQYGRAMELNSDGDIVMIGSYQDGFTFNGHVRVFQSHELIIDPESVEISTGAEDAEIYVGESLQLSATVLPEGANQSVTWSVVDGSAYASVDPVSGLVTGISEGIATVRAASVANSAIYADIEVTVVDASLTVATVNGVETSIVVAQTLQLAATILPEEASQEVTWSMVSGDGYASVSASGMVTGLAPGIATVRATSVPYGALYGEIQVTVYSVTQSVEVTTVTGEPAQTYPGGTLALQAAVLPDGANQEVTWSISSGSQYIAVSESGIVTGLQEGTAIVRATSVQDSSVYGELEVTVTEYCIPWFATGCEFGEDINDFVMEGAGIIHYGSGCSENAYGDFTGNGNLTGTLEAGTPYDFTVIHEAEGMYVNIWIDLNGNGSFEDEGELLFVSSSAGGNNQTTGTITVPETASAINTRMRVMANWFGNAEDSCTPYGSLGETHDYMVNIVEPILAESVAVTTAEGEDQEIYVAETVQLEAAVSPEDAEQGVLWSVNAGAEYANVDEMGLVTGIAPGIATIRATSVEDESVFGEIEITVVEDMGVSDLNEQAVTLYPNPTTGVLNIQSSKEIRQVEIVNLNGQSLMNAKTHSINLTVLPTGTYLVKVILTNGETVIKKVIKK